MCRSADEYALLIRFVREELSRACSLAPGGVERLKIRQEEKVVGTMFPLKSSGPRSTLEEMLDLFRTNDTQEEGTSKDNGEEARPPPLPARPTSRARLPSSVRARKQQVIAAVKLAPASKIPVDVAKENLATDSLDADKALPFAIDCLNRDDDQVPKPESFRERISDHLSATKAHADQAPQNGHTVVESTLNTPNCTNKSDLEESKAPWTCPAVVSVGRPGGSEEEAELDSRNLSFDFGGMPNGSLADEETELGRTDLSALVPEQPALPPHSPSSPAPSRKWKDDGVLRLKKVHAQFRILNYAKDRCEELVESKVLFLYEISLDITTNIISYKTPCVIF